MQAGLELNNVSKSFGSTPVLQDVSLAVEPGEFISLVGPSGCGKSTLLRIIAGLEPQSAGQVVIGRKRVDTLSPRERNIAMVFQNYALYPHMSAFDNVALPLTVSRLSLLERLPLFKYISPRRRRILREIAAEVQATAGQLQIEPLLRRKPGQLSGGQRQRVALARAMVRQPSLFLMDEPLSNLDAKLRVHMRDELADLHARLGATFIYVTHDQIEAMTMSSRVAMLDKGRLIQVGRPQDLYERPASLTVAQFIGSPAMNILPAAIGAGGQVLLFGMPVGLLAELKSGSKASLGLRPEAIRLRGSGAGAGLAVRVRRVEHHGAEQLVFADLCAPGAGALIVRAGTAETKLARIEAGTEAKVTFDIDHLHVFSEMGHRVGSRRVSASSISHEKFDAPVAVAS